MLGAVPTMQMGLSTFREMLGQRLTACPEFNLDAEFTLHEAISQLISTSMVASAHDVSEGGVLTSLDRKCYGRDRWVTTIIATRGHAKGHFPFQRKPGTDRYYRR